MNDYCHLCKNNIRSDQRLSYQSLISLLHNLNNTQKCVHGSNVYEFHDVCRTSLPELLKRRKLFYKVQHVYSNEQLDEEDEVIEEVKTGQK